MAPAARLLQGLLGGSGPAHRREVTQEEKLTWQSPAAAVSVSLPRGGGRVRADQSNRSLPPPDPARPPASCASSETGASEVRWGFHTLSHRQGTRKKKIVLFLALALFTNVAPISSQLGVHSEKQMISLETSGQTWVLTAAGAGAVLCPVRSPELSSRYEQLQPWIHRMSSPIPTPFHPQCISNSPIVKGGSLRPISPEARGAVGQGKRRTRQNQVGLASWLWSRLPKARQGFLSPASPLSS